MGRNFPAGDHFYKILSRMAGDAVADTRALLPTIKVPTLLIWGEFDKRAPLSAAYQMRDAIHGSKLEIISGAGHISNMEKPIQFNTAVNDFCMAVSTTK